MESLFSSSLWLDSERLLRETNRLRQQLSRLITFLSSCTRDVLSPPSTEESSISPIFGMLQDKSTIESARNLLSLEDRCARLKHEVDNVRREKDSLDRNIASLKAEEAGLEEKLKTRQTRIKNHVKRETERKERMPTTKEKLEREIQRLEGMKTEMKEWEAKVKTTKAQLYKQWEESKDNESCRKRSGRSPWRSCCKPQRATLAKERVRSKAARERNKETTRISRYYSTDQSRDRKYADEACVS